MRKHLFILVAVCLLPMVAFAQQTVSRHAVPGQRYLKEYWRNPDLYLEHQAWYMLDLADQALNANKPVPVPNLERKMAFLMVDAVTHEQKPIENPAVKDFMAKRMGYVLDDLDKPLKGGKKALRIYKLYNCGILYRTKDVTAAVDLNGRGGKLISDEQMGQILDHVDVLFYTHNHYDHIDNNVRKLCHEKNIPIYATEEIFAKDDKVHHLWSDKVAQHKVTSLKGELDVWTVPGHQELADDKFMQNNIWVIKLPNGKVVCSMGDQDTDKDLPYMSGIHTLIPAIDVLAMDCWIPDFEQYLAAFSPKLLISQHENEIGAHGIDHRESYWMTMFKNEFAFHLTCPYVLMTWGEWYDYK